MAQVLGHYRKVYSSGENAEFFYNDNRGSLRIAINSLGVKLDTFSYSSWGTVAHTYGSNNYLASFTGKSYDSTGMTYFNARYYDPTTGRFLTEDPSRKGVNWYAYCENDPINKTDPTGMQSALASGIARGLESVVRVDFGREEFGYAYNAPNPLMAAGWTVAGVGKMALDIGKAAAVAAAIPAVATALGAQYGVQTFSHGGEAWHAGLETPGKFNLIHIGRSSQYGIHIAIGSTELPKVADLHIYFQKALPFVRLWRPDK
jgi:RHS repeat-associated protein